MISSWHRFAIGWSRPVSEIDAQLYAKYGITKSEQKFIESMIKPMECLRKVNDREVVRIERKMCYEIAH